MSKFICLVALAALSVNALPRPDEYDIPSVGNNRRSQYFVLHDDGSHKYGYDTGDNAFESQKTNVAGDVMGQYGYTDDDGQDIRIQYTSGTSGFVAQGDHIPQVHPDVTAAFAAARAQGPFVDPLAGNDGDRSYNFDFDGEEHSRQEQSDSDGTVRGSYSYIDEFGRTRSYTYRAGKGIGFVIEGDDIPQQVQPLPTHTSTTQFGAGHRTAGSHASQHRTSGQHSTGSSFLNGLTNRGSIVRKTASTKFQSGATRRQQAKPAKPAQTYFAPTQAAHSHASAGTRSSSFNAASHSARPSVARPATTRQSTRTSASTRNFEAANTRASQSPSGSYSVAYDTSSHSRQESGDDDNNVRGKFSFVSDDDGVQRSVNYEASSATGFIAEGAHLPIGPIVPGAPTGQVTGRIVPVVQTPFVDPLAKSGLDASYSFGFESDGYSRTETADEDGNVSGTYSILGEDNILRTYRFRAGEGVGFETEEISARPGSRQSQGTVSANTRLSSSSGSSHGSSSSSSHGAASHGSSSHRGVSHGATSHGAGSKRTSFSHQKNSNQFGASSHRATPIATTYSQPQQAHSSRASAQSSSFSANTRNSAGNGASYKSSQSSEVFPGFSLRQYDPSEGRGKYGYVLKFDD